MAVSGFSEKDIHIELLNGVLTIEGNIKEKNEGGNFLVKVHHRESSSSCCREVVRLKQCEVERQ